MGADGGQQRIDGMAIFSEGCLLRLRRHLLEQFGSDIAGGAFNFMSQPGNFSHIFNGNSVPQFFQLKWQITAVLLKNHKHKFIVLQQPFAERNDIQRLHWRLLLSCH